MLKSFRGLRSKEHSGISIDGLLETNSHPSSQIPQEKDKKNVEVGSIYHFLLNKSPDILNSTFHQDGEIPFQLQDLQTQLARLYDELDPETQVSLDELIHSSYEYVVANSNQEMMKIWRAVSGTELCVSVICAIEMTLYYTTKNAAYFEGSLQDWAGILSCVLMIINFFHHMAIRVKIFNEEDLRKLENKVAASLVSFNFLAEKKFKIDEIASELFLLKAHIDRRVQERNEVETNNDQNAVSE